MTTNSRDMINIVEPASVESFFSTLIPLDATQTANRNNTRHKTCSTLVFMELIRLSLKIAQLAAIKEALGFWEI